MGRKRKPKYQAKVRPSAARSVDDDAAVPDEVLAEGSGPTEDGSVAARTAGEELVELEAPDADAPPPTAHDLADILAVVEHAEVAAEPEAARPGKKKKGGRARTASDTQVELAPEAAAEVVAEPATETVLASSEPVASKKRRGRGRTKSDTAPDVEAAAEESSPAPVEEVNEERDADGDDGDDDDAVESRSEPVEGEMPALHLVADGQESGGEIVEVGTDGELASLEATDAVADDQLVEMTDEEALAAGAELPTSAATMGAEQLKYLVEALVFASDKPMTLLRLRQLTRISDTKRLEDTLAAIASDYATRGIVLQCVSGGYQFRTRTQFSAWVQQLIAGRPVRLSRAQLETLAIVAYRQPITRPEIDDIRGVDSSGTLKVLMDRTLIRILGKKEDVGRPMLYGTTKEFLDFFSLGDLRELPTLREYSELTDESRQVINDRLGPVASDSDAVTGDAGSAADPAMLDAEGNPIVDADLSAPAAEADGTPATDDAAFTEGAASTEGAVEAHDSEIDAETDAEIEAAAAHHDEPPGMAYDDAVVAMTDDLAEGSDATPVVGADERLAEMLAAEGREDADADGDEPMMTAAGTGAMQAVDPSLIDELTGDPEAAAVVDALSKDDADDGDDPSIIDE